MGVKRLWDLLEPCGRRISIETLVGKRLAVDASGWLFQFIKAMRDERGELLRNAHLVGFFRRICRLLFHRIRPVFVFDGATPALKRQTVIARRRQREQQQVRLRRTAEKLLLNQLKQAALRQVSSLQGASVESQEPGAAESVAPAEQGTSDGTQGPEPATPTQEEQEADVQLVEADEQLDLDAEDLIGENAGEIDAEVLSQLPPSLQLEVMLKLREAQVVANRERFASVQGKPMAFSEVQMAQYLKATAFRRQVNDIKAALSARASAQGVARRIAGEADREYVLQREMAGGDNASQASAGEEENAAHKKRPPEGGPHRHQEDQVYLSGEKDGQSPSPVPAPVKPEPLVLTFTATDLGLDATTTGDEEGGLDWEDVEHEPTGHEPGLPGLGSAGAAAALGLREQRGLHWRERAARRQKFWSMAQGFRKGRTLADWGRVDAGGSSGSEADGPEAADSGEDEQLQAAIAASLRDAVPSSTAVDADAAGPSDSFARASERRVRKDEPTTTIAFQEDANLLGNEASVPEGDGVLTVRVPGSTVPVVGPVSAAEAHEEEAWEEDIVHPDDGPTENAAHPTATAVQQTNAASAAALDEYLRRTGAGGGESVHERIALQLGGDDAARVALSSLAEPRPKRAPGHLAGGSADAVENAAHAHGAGASNQRQLSSGPAGGGEAGLLEGSTLNERERAAADQSSEQIAGLLETLPCPVIQPSPGKVTMADRTEQMPSAAPDKAWAETVDLVPAAAVVLPRSPGDVSGEPNATVDGLGVGQPGATSAREAPVIEDVTHDVAADDDALGPAASQLHTGNTVAESTRNGDEEEDSGEEASIDYGFGPGLLPEDAEAGVRLLQSEARRLQGAQRAQRGQSDSPTDEMYTEIQELLQMFGVPYIVAPGEAEAQCAWLDAHGLVDGVVTDDNDAFVFGARTVYRHIFSVRHTVEEYRAQDVAAELGIAQPEFISLALLLGSDYTPGVKGIGIVNAAEVVRAFKGAEGLRVFKAWVEQPLPELADLTTKAAGSSQPSEEVHAGHDLSADADDGSAALRRAFQFRHRGVRRNWELPADFPSAEVVQAYTKPRVDSSRERFQNGRPDVQMLREFCLQRLGWTVAQADELIQPMIKSWDAKERQLTLEPFLAFRKRFAKIQSKRLKQAVRGIAGKANPGIELHGGGDSSVTVDTWNTEPAGSGETEQQMVSRAGVAERPAPSAKKDTAAGRGKRRRTAGGAGAGDEEGSTTRKPGKPADPEPVTGLRRSQRRKPTAR